MAHNHPTPEELKLDIWQQILMELQYRLTRTTYEQWLQDSRLVSQEGQQLTVAVSSRFSREWLTGRLADVVQQIATELASHPFAITYVLAEQPIETEPDSTLPRPDQRPEPEIGPILAGQISQTVFTPHLKFLNAKTGYAPLPHYYLEFWESYLTARWGETGRKAFLLHRKLAAFDRRKVTGATFTNWSPAREFSTQELADMLAVGPIVITGRRGHCRQYEVDRRNGRPRGYDCCGRHQADACRIEASPRSGKLHCYFQRSGILTVLETEKLVRVKAAASGRRLKLQIWHSLPVLTPFQVRFLPQKLRDSHRAWLTNHSTTMGWTPRQWSATPDTVETFVDCAPDYQHHQEEIYV